MKAKNKTERLIAVGDVHGEYRLLRELIEKRICFDPETDRLVFLGDYIDRGLSSREVVEYLISFRRKYPDNIILLTGNHEDMARKALLFARPGDSRQAKNFEDTHMWYSNGGSSTIESFGDMENTANTLLPFIDSLELYYETKTHIFVHAGVSYSMDLVETPLDVLLWSRDAISHISGKHVLSGHSIHREVTFYKGVTAIDTGAFKHGLLSAYDVMNKKIYSAFVAGRDVKL